MRLHNSGQRAWCISETDTREGIRFEQAGREANPFEYSSRAMLQWKGAELISGLVVVPPGKHVEVYYDLSEWSLKQGDTAAAITLPVFDCLEFFQSKSPQPQTLRSTFRFDATTSPTPQLSDAG